jgi:hypothetical protein
MSDDADPFASGEGGVPTGDEDGEEQQHQQEENEGEHQEQQQEDGEDGDAEEQHDGGDDNGEVKEEYNDIEDEEDPFPKQKSSDAAQQEQIQAQQDDSALREFNKKFQQICLEKDDEEMKERKKMSLAGKAELDTFTTEKLTTRKTRAAANREQEKSLLADIESALKSDNSWARVVSLVDLSTDPDNKSDTSRLRNLLIRLKAGPGSSSKVEATAAAATGPSSSSSASTSSKKQKQ